MVAHHPLQLGLFTEALADRPLEEALRWIAAQAPRIEYVEIGTGGYSAQPHCDLRRLLESHEDRRAFLAALESHGLRLAALNVSGNPLEVAGHDHALRGTIRLAPLLDVDRIVCMSGGDAALAGGGWFPGIENETEQYWRDRVLPYWREIAATADRESPSLLLCLELEPGSAVFNASTYARIVTAGENLALNLDPSHFFWQGIDPLAIVRQFSGRIGFAHGKDTVLDLEKVAVDGVVDRSSWRYATVGEGHDTAWWQAFLEQLRAAGYAGPISIEYEDEALSAEESIVQAACVLQQAEGRELGDGT
jgi:sugar phosphate isomerase/epimerase